MSASASSASWSASPWTTTTAAAWPVFGVCPPVLAVGFLLLLLRLRLRLRLRLLVLVLLVLVLVLLLLLKQRRRWRLRVVGLLCLHADADAVLRRRVPQQLLTAAAVGFLLLPTNGV